MGLAVFPGNDGIAQGKEGSITSFFVEDPILFAGPGHGLNLECVDDMVLALDDLSPTE